MDEKLISPLSMALQKMDDLGVGFDPIIQAWAVNITESQNGDVSLHENLVNELQDRKYKLSVRLGIEIGKIKPPFANISTNDEMQMWALIGYKLAFQQKEFKFARRGARKKTENIDVKRARAIDAVKTVFSAKGERWPMSQTRRQSSLF